MSRTPCLDRKSCCQKLTNQWIYCLKSESPSAYRTTEQRNCIDGDGNGNGARWKWVMFLWKLETYASHEFHVKFNQCNYCLSFFFFASILVWCYCWWQCAAFFSSLLHVGAATLLDSTIAAAFTWHSRESREWRRRLYRSHFPSSLTRTRIYPKVLKDFFFRSLRKFEWLGFSAVERYNIVYLYSRMCVRKIHEILDAGDRGRVAERGREGESVTENSVNRAKKFSKQSLVFCVCVCVCIRGFLCFSLYVFVHCAFEYRTEQKLIV